jgi:hypothetical protein
MSMKLYLYDRRKPRALKPSAWRSGGKPLRATVTDLAPYRTTREPGPRWPHDDGSSDMRAFIERVRSLATQI